MSVVTEPTEAHIPAEIETQIEAELEILGHATQTMRAAPDLAPAANDVPVTVDIYDQTYHLRGQDPAYIESLAEIVDGKMRAVAAGGTTVDSLRVAVLAALNIADELMRMQSKYHALSGSVSETENSLRNRTASLSGLLDSILTDDRKLG